MSTAIQGVRYGLIAINWIFDQLVYLLYGLTGEEITIVEGRG